jgi:protein-L-isoaspartate(D-aspartate) O-methyltransferase
MALIDNLIKEGWLKTPRISEAFRKIKRVDFLPEDSKDLAELNEALPIGYGQTISQPLVVAFMLELLSPEPGEKILDIGSGSGWTSALLGEIVGPRGKIIAIDIVPELVEFGQNNVKKYNLIERGIVEFIYADGSKGYEKEAPFDKILASASAEILPQSWKEQLKIGGRIVTPIGSSIWLFIKNKKEGDEPSAHLRSAINGFVFEEIEYPGFVFVPLITRR